MVEGYPIDDELNTYGKLIKTDSGIGDDYASSTSERIVVTLCLRNCCAKETARQRGISGGESKRALECVHSRGLTMMEGYIEAY
jgi:hypothetical protein